MIKKDYQKSEMKVIEVDIIQQLLAGSLKRTSTGLDDWDEDGFDEDGDDQGLAW